MELGDHPAAVETRAGHVAYFAYGSNMLSARLAARVNGALRLARATLSGFRLRFDKRGLRDGSGKCRVQPTERAGDLVWGVLWSLPESQLPGLHRAEGVGYGYAVGHCAVAVASGSGPQRRVRAITYHAQPSALSSELRPYDWYLEMVIAGAIEHRLPGRYLERLRATEAWPDPHSEHARAARALLARARRPAEHDSLRSRDLS